MVDDDRTFQDDNSSQATYAYYDSASERRDLLKERDIYRKTNFRFVFRRRKGRKLSEVISPERVFRKTRSAKNKNFQTKSTCIGSTIHLAIKTRIWGNVHKGEHPSGLFSDKTTNNKRQSRDASSIS
ncbi:hypothetical protein CBL_07264 [Carabus blaptoides fortunei]